MLCAWDSICREPHLTDAVCSVLEICFNVVSLLKHNYHVDFAQHVTTLQAWRIGWSKQVSELPQRGAGWWSWNFDGSWVMLRWCCSTFWGLSLEISRNYLPYMNGFVHLARRCFIFDAISCLASMAALLLRTTRFSVRWKLLSHGLLGWHKAISTGRRSN